MNWKLSGIFVVLALILTTAYFAHQVGLEAQPQSQPTASYQDQGSRVENYELGESTVSIVLSRSNDSSLLFFNMHDDENTAIEAATEILPEMGGSLLHLEHSGERLIEFTLEGTVYRFDPNRIFTEGGARRTLLRYGPFSLEAFQMVRAFAEHLVDFYQLDRRPVIITIHNNTEGSYSAESYRPGGEYENDARDAFIASGCDPDDFFFVTDAEHFRLFKREGFNVVLQDNERVTDDGSLSVLAGRAGLPYINVEAQHEHLAEQKQMLRVLYRVLALVQSPDK